jgi:hypothetical protein
MLAGAATSLPGLRQFCVFALVAVVVDFSLQVSFFTTVLSIDMRRLEVRVTSAARPACIRSLGTMTAHQLADLHDSRVRSALSAQAAATVAAAAAAAAGGASASSGAAQVPADDDSTLRSATPLASPLTPSPTHHLTPRAAVRPFILTGTLVRAYACACVVSRAFVWLCMSVPIRGQCVRALLPLHEYD